MACNPDRQRAAAMRMAEMIVERLATMPPVMAVVIEHQAAKSQTAYLALGDVGNSMRRLRERAATHKRGEDAAHAAQLAQDIQGTFCMAIDEARGNPANFVWPAFSFVHSFDDESDELLQVIALQAPVRASVRTSR
jgi:hypothetical protein